jgi:CRP/FNR family cyclic AMP-dependent transcriptional regulator
MRHPLTETEFSRNAGISEIVDGSTLFKEFDSQTSTKLVRVGIEARFVPGQFIFEEHDQSGQFYYITSGSVALEQPAREHAIRIRTLREGDFLGWSALLGSGTRHFQARALTEVAALTFDGERLRKTCDDDPRFGYAMMKRLLLLVTERLDVVRAQLAESRRGEVRDWMAGATSH